MSTVSATNLKHASSASNNIVLDSSGNVGIGTSSPGYKLDINGITGWGANQTAPIANIVGANAPTNGGGNLRVLSNTSATADAGGSLVLGGYYTAQTNSIDFAEISGRKQTGQTTGGYLALSTRADLGNQTERLRIDSSGNLLVGTTSTNPNPGVGFFPNGTASLGNNNQSSGFTYVYFQRNGGTIGSITQSGTTNVAYNTSSDYRLKHDVQPMVSGLSTVSALKPCTYKWNADNSYGEGFIAHELQAIIPQAVTGEKDAVNDDGSIKSQGVDYSKIVVHLVAAIQELSAKVAALEAKQ